MKRLLFAAVLLAFACLPAKAEMSVPEGERVTLQAVMQNYIDRNLVDGAMLELDEATGKVRPLYPTTAHPMIETLGRYYYLCANFRDEQGKEVMVNFFVARDQDNYVIFHTNTGVNEQLEHLIEKNSTVSSN